MCCVCVGGGQWLECPASGAGPFLSTAYELAMLAATPSSSSRGYLAASVASPFCCVFLPCAPAPLRPSRCLSFSVTLLPWVFLSLLVSGNPRPLRPSCKPTLQQPNYMPFFIPWPALLLIMRPLFTPLPMVALLPPAAPASAFSVV